MNHFHFPSGRYEETIRFYEHFFGFRRSRIIGRTHILIGKDGFLLAIDEDDTTHAIPKEIHLGFTLKNAQEVKILFQQMLEYEVPISGPLLAPSDRATHFYCKDPSGNRVEVGWYEI